MFLMNHTPTYFMDLLLPVKKHDKTRGQLVISVHMEPNSAEWVTLSCGHYISKIHIKFYFCCGLED